MAEPIKEYDKNNNEIYFKNSYGFECWYEYDKRNNIIHTKNSYGYEYWYKYDERNNLIYLRNSYGYESWSEYDENNERIEITQKEFEQAKFEEEQKEFLSRKEISIFELMDI